MLIDELKAIQRAHGYLPEGALRDLSERASIPLYEIHGVATFYPHFRLKPPSRLEIALCADMSCHLGGAARLRALVAEALGPEERVEVREVSCLGRCDEPPAFSMNGEIYSGLAPGPLNRLLLKALSGEKTQAQRRPHKRPAWRADPYEGGEPYGGLREVLRTGGFEGVIENLKASALRGMGGAGFPAGVKWEIVRRAPGEEKYVICNADESEPGTFKDRVLLETAPHLVLEGMTLGGLTVGARKGIVYLRHEYAREGEAFRREIRACQRAGLLGEDVLGSGLSFDVEVFESPGGYICGEETALLEALEGRRAEPRNRPPFPGTFGLYGKPTLINNVETFALVPGILLRGPGWFQAQGAGGKGGLKFLALSGHVRRPGVYEVPLGISARDFIGEMGGGVAGGRGLKAFAPGGASSGFLPGEMADTPLSFEGLAKVGSMLGSGAVVAIAEGTCMLDLARNMVRFFKNESCGKCVPCRMGSEKMVEILGRFQTGGGEKEDFKVIEDLSEVMRETSICGLGQSAPNPILSALAHFRDEVEAHLSGRCPEGVCFRNQAP